MPAAPVSVIVRLTLLASVHGFSRTTTGHLSTCRYPLICQDDCAEGFVQPRCADPSGDCPCIIQACWMLNGSCIHACNQTSLVACLECIDGRPKPACDVECSGVCLDAGCEHSQGECHGCVPGVYGQSCSRSCASVCNGACYKDTGFCKVCQQRRHGEKCEHTCPDNCHACSSQNGTCLRCARGYTGEHCTRPCSDGHYGVECRSKCSRNCAGKCDSVSGACVGGCKPGYFRSDCGQMCPLGKFGQDCVSECAVTCVDKMVCHHINGSCTRGCGPGFRGEQCAVPCPQGTYGNNCSKNCSQNCLFGVCNSFSGHCKRCDIGRVGPFCDYVTHARRMRTNRDDGTMTTDQTILIFLGLFSLGGGMWFLLATFVYYKQKIAMKKVQQTGQLPRNWTSIVRRYPQYFYSPVFLNKSAAHKAATLPRRKRAQAEKVRSSLLGEFTRQVPHDLCNKVHMQGQRKSVLKEKLRKNTEMETPRKNVAGLGDNVDVEGQKHTLTVGSTEANPVSEKHISEDKINSPAKTESKVKTDTCAQGYSPDHVLDEKAKGKVNLLTKRGQNHEQLAPMFEMEDLVGEKAVRRTAQGVGNGTENVKTEPTNSRRDLHVISRAATVQGSPRDLHVISRAETALDSPRDLHVISRAATALDSPRDLHVKSRAETAQERDAAGDKKNSSVFDMSITATTSLETKIAEVPQGDRRSADILQGEGIPDQTLRHGLHIRNGEDNKKTPQKERRFIVGEAPTSATSTACPECGRQYSCSMECQCSVVTTASTQQHRFPAVLQPAKSSPHHQHLGKQFLPERQLSRELSRTSSSYSNMKLVAAHGSHSRTERVLLKRRGPEARVDTPQNERHSTSKHTLISSLEAATAVPSAAGETETESGETEASSSGSNTLQTSTVKTGSSRTTASEDEVSEYTSTITEASRERVVFQRPAITESQHQRFQAALERQSQHYVAKTDLWPVLGQENPPNQGQWSYAQKSQYDAKPRGVFKRSFRNVVGVFGKLMGMGPEVRPQGVVDISGRAAESAETRLSSDVMVHGLDPWRRDRQAAPAAPLSEMTSRRLTRTSSRPPTFAIVKTDSTTDTMTDRSSARSSTVSSSSRTNKEDSTLTDASDLDNSTETSSEEESASSTAAASEASNTAGETAASTSSDMSEASTGKQTTTEAESPLSVSKSDSPHSSRHRRSHRHRHRQ